MKKLFAIFCIWLTLLTVPAFAANWFANACNSTNMSACSWVPTHTGSCTGSGTALVWANRVAGDNYYANGCTAITVDADPGVGGSPSTLINDNSNSATAGGYFQITGSSITATVNVTAGGVAPTGNGALQISGTGTGNTVGCTTCVFQGGSISNSGAIVDTHTVSTVVVKGYAKAGSAAGTFGYTNTAASGVVDGGATSGALNCLSSGSTYGCNLGSNGSTMSINNSITSDVSGSFTGGATAGGNTAAGAMTFVGSLVGGKYNAPALQGKGVPVPASTASAIYFGVNSSYASTDIVDANGNVKGSPTLTNAYVFVSAFATNGIGTGCGPTNCSNVKNAITFGPYTGNLSSTGQNSGSVQ